MEMTACQEGFVKDFTKWYEREDCTKVENLIYTLSGNAGTGKTFIVTHLTKNILKIPENRIVYVAISGKAVSRLIEKGVKNAMTYHSLVYLPISEQVEVDGEIKTVVKGFSKRKTITDYDLVVFDEVSMASKEHIDDLLSFNVKVLATGDDGQLPPVGGESHVLLDKPNWTLDTIVRQSEDSEIIRVATMARNKEYIPYGKYGNDVYVLDYKNIKEEIFNGMLISANQILAGRNATVAGLNARSRRILGYEENKPQIEDKIIFLHNSNQDTIDVLGKYPIRNGVIANIKDIKEQDKDYLANISFKADFLDDIKKDIVIDTGCLYGNKLTYDRGQKAHELKDGTYAKMRSLIFQGNKEDKELYAKFKKNVAIEMINRKQSIDEKTIYGVDYAYAITIHKAQGSEWDTVLIIDESGVFRNVSHKWLYTAITRGKKRIVIVRNYSE